MRKIAKEMEEREKEMMESSVEGRKLLMKMRIKFLHDELSKLDHEDTKLDEELASVNQQIKEVKSAEEILKESSRDLNENEEIKRYQLIDQIEMLKKEKSFFKSHCRDKKKCLEEDIYRMKIDLADRESGSKYGSGEKMEKLKQTLSSEEARLKETQLKLGTICKNISRFQRRLDDIPSRSELSQYQRRFVELYDQSKCRHLSFFNYLLMSSLYHSLYSWNETYRNEEILHSIQSTR